MARPQGLTRELFLSLSQAAGLDPADPHLEELWPAAQAMWRGLARLDELDLGDSEPSTRFSPAKE